MELETTAAAKPVAKGPSVAKATAARQTVECWAAIKKTPDWLFVGAKIHSGWPVGAEVTEEEFDAVCAEHSTTPIGYQVHGLSRSK